MSTISDAGGSIKVVIGTDIKYLDKDSLKIEINGNVLRLTDAQKVPYDLPYADITSPSSTDIEDLAEQIDDMQEATLASGAATAAKQDELITNTAPLKKTQTYSAGVSGLVPDALATDIFTIKGSATKLVKVKKIIISGTKTVAGNVDIFLVRRTTANTGGTSTLRRAMLYDSTNAAETVEVLAYTLNPTLGTLQRAGAVEKMFFSLSTSFQEKIRWEFDLAGSQAQVLRGTSEILAVNLNGVTVTGGNMDIYTEWTEEPLT